MNIDILKIRDQETKEWKIIHAIKGDTGPKGDKGDTGPQGPKGEGLPEVTEADNGKFAIVQNGVWSASTVPDAEVISY